MQYSVMSYRMMYVCPIATHQLNLSLGHIGDLIVHVIPRHVWNEHTYMYFP